MGPTFRGIPLGIFLLTSVHQHLAIIIVVFSAYFLPGKNVPELRTDDCA